MGKKGGRESRVRWASGTLCREWDRGYTYVCVTVSANALIVTVAGWPVANTVSVRKENWLKRMISTRQGTHNKQ